MFFQLFLVSLLFCLSFSSVFSSSSALIIIVALLLSCFLRLSSSFCFIHFEAEEGRERQNKERKKERKKEENIKI